jgi:hypothetical protein
MDLAEKILKTKIIVREQDYSISTRRFAEDFLSIVERTARAD